MSHALSSLAAGLRATARRGGLVALLWLLNLGFASLLAVPLALRLESALEGRGASSSMMYGFDWGFWDGWHERQDDHARELHPRIFGRGRPLRNLELLLSGALPLGLFRGPVAPAADPLVLGLGAAYGLLQGVLMGGILALLRGPGEWSVRSLLHATGFYAGRMLRLVAVGLAVLWLVFAAAAVPGAALEARAAASPAEDRAGLLLLAARLPLVLGILAAALVGSWSRVVVVMEDRRSALLAWLQALGLCLRHPVSTGLVSGAALAAGVALVVAAALAEESAWITGWRTQLALLLAAQAVVAARIALRVAHAGAQVELYRRLGYAASRSAGARAADAIQDAPR